MRVDKSSPLTEKRFSQISADEQISPAQLTIHQRIGDRYQLIRLLCNGGISQNCLAEGTRLFQLAEVVKRLSAGASDAEKLIN